MVHYVRTGHIELVRGWHTDEGLPNEVFSDKDFYGPILLYRFQKFPFGFAEARSIVVDCRDSIGELIAVEFRKFLESLGISKLPKIVRANNSDRGRLRFTPPWLLFVKTCAPYNAEKILNLVGLSKKPPLGIVVWTDRGSVDILNIIRGTTIYCLFMKYGGRTFPARLCPFCKKGVPLTRSLAIL